MTKPGFGRTLVNSFLSSNHLKSLNITQAYKMTNQNYGSIWEWAIIFNKYMWTFPSGSNESAPEEGGLLLKKKQ